MDLRPDLRLVVADLLARAGTDLRVSLDALAEALGARAVTTAEIDAMIDALEAAGCVVDRDDGARASASLRELLGAARALTAELGRRPTRAEIAARAGLSEEAVQIALAFARVLQR